MKNRLRVPPGFVAIPILIALASRAGAGEDPAATADRILVESGVRGGLVVLAEFGDGRTAAAIGRRTGFLVHGLVRSRADLERMRPPVEEADLYGRVALDGWDGATLPYADNLVNLIVARDGAAPRAEEIQRALAPGGVALLAREGAWKKVVKARPADIDEWTHYFHGADGNPVAHDRKVGPPRGLQWVGSPLWSRHHDHMASMTSLVATGGRLFYILDEGPLLSIQLPPRWRLIARDAFNGTVLWKRDLDSWNTHQWPLKSGPAHLVRRLVAAGDVVYVTLGLEAPTTALDAATGSTVRTYEGSDRTREILLPGRTLLVVTEDRPSDLPEWRRRATFVWDNSQRANAGWAWSGGARRVLAYEADSGRKLWEVESAVAPCSLAADGKRAVLHDGSKLVCYSIEEGKRLWDQPAAVQMPVPTGTGPRTLLHEDVVLFAGNDGKVSAFSATDGTRLWQGEQPPSGHASLKDLMVVGGLVWSAPIAGGRDSGIFTGRDLLTGEVRKTFAPDVDTYWFHHRCYPSKATDRFILTSRTGVEFIDPASEHWEPHHWVRGGCIYGVLPCNGMLYAPMNSCGCYLESKLEGFNALVPAPVGIPDPRALSDEARLERGPAHGHLEDAAPGAADWPTYRHDPARSGATTQKVGADLATAWSARIGGRLSPPVVAGGHVLVASIDAHALHAMDARSGKALWKFTAGGRIDSPPTIWRGLALFGSTDGYIYALRTSDGALAWRYRAAPLDRRIVAHEQLESAWPVHGSVLVHDGVLHATAGRSVFLDGGIRFLKLDASTGRRLAEVVWDDRDPETGKNLQVQVRGLNMPVALADILSFDGKHLYMRSQKIDLEGKRIEIPVAAVEAQHAEDPHLFCQVGFLDDSWFHRSYWTYGRRVSGGYGGWAIAGRYVPAGRILVFDDSRVYGYGRKPEYYVNASVLEYHLFAAEKRTTAEAAQRVRTADGRINARLDRQGGNSSDWRLRAAFPPEDLTAVRYGWRLDQPAVQFRALASTAENLFAAGHPDTIDERRAFREPDDPEVRDALLRQAEAIEGRHGGRLWVISKTDGRAVARYHLESPPVFDGLAVANGRLYLAAMDGSVLCLAEGNGTMPTREDPGAPLRTFSEEPESPTYLLPPETDRSGEFDGVRGCRVLACDLAYRLKPTGGKPTCVALRKLDVPLTGSVTLSCRMRVPEVSGYLVNGFIAFGDGASAEHTVKCGIRYRSKKALIVQGPLDEPRASTSAALDSAIGKTVDLRVRVDLAAHTVTFTVEGRTVEAALQIPLKSITHVGYATDNAVAEFSPITTEP